MIVRALKTVGLCHWSVVVSCLLIGSLAAGRADAQTVWSGFDFSFSRPAFVEGTEPEHQDMLTPDVIFARRSAQGLYNAAVEAVHEKGVSPIDTAWATDLVTGNQMETIAATNFANLTFTNWVDAFGGLASGQLPQLLTSRNAVVHLITDDIYLDIQFTSWGGSGDANFAYMRSVPEPTTLIPATLAIMLTWRRRRERL